MKKYVNCFRRLGAQLRRLLRVNVFVRQRSAVDLLLDVGLRLRARVRVFTTLLNLPRVNKQVQRPMRASSIMELRSRGSYPPPECHFHTMYVPMTIACASAQYLCRHNDFLNSRLALSQFFP